MSGRVWWDGISDDGKECGGVVVRRDMSGGKGHNRLVGSRLFGDGGWMIGRCVVGGDDGCLLSGGESVWGGIIFTFFLAGLVGRELGGLRRLLTLPLLGRISFNLPPQPGVLLPKHFHLVNTALFQVGKFLLHFGLAFEDSDQVWGNICRHSRARLRVLHGPGSAAGGDHSR